MIKTSQQWAAIFVSLMIASFQTNANDLVPLGSSNTGLYYQIGGGNNYVLPPVQSSNSIYLNSDADLGAGYSCGAFNPIMSIRNSFNDLKNSADNIEESVIANLQGSIAEYPMYLLAQADPDLYNLVNNTLLSSHQKLDVSTKTCEVVKQEISQGKNPYQDWGTISVNDQWKKHLSLTATGNEDMNDAKKDIDQHSGDDGVPWVQGVKTSSGHYAGGKGQPVIHVVSDTVKAGYNALLDRDLSSDAAAPNNANNTALVEFFPNPQAAQHWITSVVGDQNVTTCTTDTSCQRSQGGVAGRGLLPWVSSCSVDMPTLCAENIRSHLAQLVSGNTPITNENLSAVSADGVMMSPQIITAIRSMDSTQQGIVVNKLSQEVATQRVIDMALLARNILQTGSQVPVVASNKPAQTILQQSIHSLDNDIQSLSFESKIRKDMTSSTLSHILDYQQVQQQSAVSVPKTQATPAFISNGAVTSTHSF